MYEQIGTIIVAAKLLTERCCRKLCTGSIPWSLKYALLQARISLWHMVRKILTRHRNSTRLLRRHCREALISVDIQDCFLELYKLELDKAYKEMSAFRKTAKAVRTTHLEELAEARTAAGLEQGASVLKQMIRREHELSNWRLIKQINGYFMIKKVVV